MDARCHIEMFGTLRVTQSNIVHTRFRRAAGDKPAARLRVAFELCANRFRRREHG